MHYRKLWIVLGLVAGISFLILGIAGYRGIRSAPPIPQQVVTTDGRVLFDGTTIRDGQNVWQSIGGQEIGSIFGHGAYVAPDWTADYLHREASRMTAPLELRRNTYDAATGVLTISPERARAFDALTAYYADVFRAGLKEFAIPKGALTD